MRPHPILTWSDLADRTPTPALVEGVDLVVVRFDDDHSVLYGRCLHRGALLADGFVSGKNLMCGVHFWDYRVDTGISEYNNAERLAKFACWVEGGEVCVDADEVKAWHDEHPQPFNREEYLGQYADTHPVAEEDKVGEIQHLAKHGLEKWGHHGNSAAMGVPRTELPRWDDIQVLTAQLQADLEFTGGCVHGEVGGEALLPPLDAVAIRGAGDIR